MTDDPATIRDWLNAHRTLIEAERRLADVAEQLALGQATQEELDEQHEIVMSLRALSEAVLRKALARPAA